MLPPISDDETALLRAVCLDPWDDLPRLVMADWYDEQGRGKLAELIRAQCEHARAPTDATMVRAWDARARAGLLDPGPHDRVLGPLAGTVAGTARGWPDRVLFRDWHRFEAARLAGLFARVPAVRAGGQNLGLPRGGRVLSDWAPGEPAAGCVLPRVYRRLLALPSPAPTRDGLGDAEYASERAAAEALSRALVDEGRAAAGLPPLARPALPDPPG